MNRPARTYLLNPSVPGTHPDIDLFLAHAAWHFPDDLWEDVYEAVDATILDESRDKEYTLALWPNYEEKDVAYLREAMGRWEDLTTFNVTAEDYRKVFSEDRSAVPTGLVPIIETPGVYSHNYWTAD